MDPLSPTVELGFRRAADELFKRLLADENLGEFARYLQPFRHAMPVDQQVGLAVAVADLLQDWKKEVFGDEPTQPRT